MCDKCKKKKAKVVAVCGGKEVALCTACAEALVDRVVAARNP